MDSLSLDSEAEGTNGGKDLEPPSTQHPDPFVFASSCRLKWLKSHRMKRPTKSKRLTQVCRRKPTQQLLCYRRFWWVADPLVESPKGPQGPKHVQSS